MADYGYDNQKFKDRAAEREAEAARVKEAVENMRKITPPSVPTDTVVTAGGARALEEDGTLGEVPAPDPIVLRELKMKLADARERRARAQDLPETSRARQEAELNFDKIVEEERQVKTNKLMDPSEGPLSATSHIAAGGCNVPFPSPYPGVPAPAPSPYWGTTTTLTPPKTGVTMDVFIIWAILPDQPDAPWAIAAWDDESIAENEEGWLEALAEAENEHGGRNVRVTKTSINYDNVVAAFKPVSI